MRKYIIIYRARQCFAGMYIQGKKRLDSMVVPQPAAVACQRATARQPGRQAVPSFPSRPSLWLAVVSCWTSGIRPTERAPKPTQSGPSSCSGVAYCGTLL